MCARGDAGCIVDTPCKIYYGLGQVIAEARLCSKCLKLSLKGSLLPTLPSLTNNSTASLAL